ncbi:MAG: hypothetical protein SH847_18035 [Roseiflexaceae bacterium]|nr:hypothetical protein [Roseiflexaceae bacterium]
MTETTQALTLQPYAGLKSLNKLVGTWNVSGPDIKGQVIFEWMEGGFFLIQHVGFVHTGRRIAGIEIIGYELPFGAEQPSEQIKSHWFGSGGETFEYTYEADDETLTIWGGEKGSPAYYKGIWSADGNTNAGAWVYPNGGYESTLTRV